MSSTGHLTLNAVTIANGFSIRGAGGIENHGTTLLFQTTLKHNYNALQNWRYMVVDQSRIINNRGTEAALYNSYLTGTSATVRNTLISGNTSINAPIVSLGNINIVNTIVSNNRAATGSAGGAAFYDGAQVIIADSTFTGNQSRNGAGGIYLGHETIITLIRTVVSGNQGPDAPGFSQRGML